MPACLPTRNNRDRHDRLPSRTSGEKRPHSPPTRGGVRLRVTAADLSASITVFLIAVPMSLGLAVAMDAPLEAGLISAALGGIVAGLIGGTPLQVSGPSAGLTVVTAELIQVYGWRTTCAITIGAGLLQILLGSLRTARGALAVSPAIVHGTLAGIGVAIALAQLHIVLGGSPRAPPYRTPCPFRSSWRGSARPPPDRRPDHRPAGGLAAPSRSRGPGGPEDSGRARVGRGGHGGGRRRRTRYQPGGPALVAVPRPARAPQGPVLALATAMFTVMLVGSLESLLAAVAVDKLAADRTAEQAVKNPDMPPRHVARSDLDRELRGQGITNMLAGLLGGLPISGGAVRSSANVRAGATGRAATVLHGVWVLLATGFLVFVLEWIPLAALAALVMVVGIQMVKIAHIRNVHRHREVLVYGATITGVVGFGVLAGVAVGIATAVGMALHRLARTRISVSESDGRFLVTVRGQLTFLAVPRLSRVLNQLPQGVDAIVELDGFFMDHAAYEAIQDWRTSQVAQGGQIVFTGRSGGRIAEPASAAHSCCRPWTPWRNHHCHDRPHQPTPVSGRPHVTPGPAGAPSPARADDAARHGTRPPTAPRAAWRTHPAERHQFLPAQHGSAGP